MTKGGNVKHPSIRDSQDLLYAAVNAMLSPLPFAPSIFEALLKSPMEQRRLVWEKKITEAVNTLTKQNNLSIEALSSDERFVSVALHSTAIAIKNHQQEKITALANAVVNSAIVDREDSDEFLDLLFIRYIDELTPFHFRLLAFFVSLGKEFTGINSYPLLFDLVNKQLTISANRDEFILIVNDLAGKGLIRISRDVEDFEDLYKANSLLLESTDDSLPRMVVTDIGIKFTEFISKAV